jgi:HTH-type transcriptional regulator / antitoxin HigA
MTGKMTLTFNPELYTTLLIQHQPKPIANDAEYEATIALASELEHRPHLTAEEETLLELLLTLIEKYEATHAPIPNSPGSSVLKHLMEAQDITIPELTKIFGDTTIVEQILTGQQSISLTEAETLAVQFNVPAQVFL